MPIDQRVRSTYRLISSDGHIVEPRKDLMLAGNAQRLYKFGR